ncbi:MAG TPA: hypothetical protein VFN38_09450 [Gemmatimonadaceae bacterium]|nr:hypothetical protein [Gemmatimonadaceae bacterium]
MRLLMMLPAALLALALAPAGAGAQLAAPAAVPHSVPAQPEVGMEDEALIFTPQADSIAAQWRTMGVDYVRIQAYWNALSPATKSRTIPAGFDPSNPNSPGYNWAPLDAAIAAVRNNGMHVMLTLNQSNPRWASTQPSRTQASWMPNPTRFAQFVTAVGKRYGQQVDRYLMLSEPNQLPFLAPQFTCRGRKCTPVAPHLARSLSNAGYTAIKAADPGAQVIVGELAPIGSPPSRTSGITPLLFLQQMGCVNTKFRPIRTGLCRGFKAVRGDGFGYHPYVNTKTSPFTATRNKQLAKIGDMPRLLSWLDQLTRKRRLRASTGRFRVYLTEYGYITFPPNRRYGVSQAKQSVFNAQSAYVVWLLRSRIKLLTQYEFNDDRTFPTGLRFNNGRPKTAFFTFPTPFFIDTRRGLARARFWGQVRPDAQRSVAIQIKQGATFSTVATLSTDAGGYFTRVMRAQRRATYRFQYVTLAGTTQTSQTFRT